MVVLRAALYPRVSTEEQAKFGYSIKTQIDALTEYCKDNKIKIVDIYTEEGVSGGKAAMKRPQMARLLEDVKAGKIDIVLFTKLDRWFRNVKEYFKVQEILDKHKVEWKAIHEDYDTTTANGRMAITIFLAIAQNEREKTAERIKVVFDNKTKNKEAFFGWQNMPFGYTSQKDENGVSRLVKDPALKDALQTFWDMAVKYHNISKAGKYVNKVYGLSRGRRLWYDTVHREIYTGTRNGITDYCEPYVSREDWERLQHIQPIKETQHNRVYLFTGLMKCPVCGKNLSSTYGKNIRKGVEYEYFSYRCQHSDGWTCEYKKRIPELATEKWLLKNLDDLIKNEIAHVEIERTKPKPKPKVNIPALREKLRRLEVVYMAGNKTDEEYISETKEIKDLITKAEIENLTHEDSRDLSSLQHLLETDFRSLYSTLDKEEKRRFWRSIIKEIIIEGNRPKSVIFLH